MGNIGRTSQNHLRLTIELHFSQCFPNPNKRVPIKPLYAYVPVTDSGVVWDTHESQNPG
jgi:hypothetical protein